MNKYRIEVPISSLKDTQYAEEIHLSDNGDLIGAIEGHIAWAYATNQWKRVKKVDQTDRS